MTKIKNKIDVLALYINRGDMVGVAMWNKDSKGAEPYEMIEQKRTNGCNVFSGGYYGFRCANVETGETYGYMFIHQSVNTENIRNVQAGPLDDENRRTPCERQLRLMYKEIQDAKDVA